MFGAIAPFENVVVLCAVALGVSTGSVSVLTIAVSVALNAGLLVPAAESTHVFMSVRLMRLDAVGARLGTATTVAWPNLPRPFAAAATKVVN